MTIWHIIESFKDGEVCNLSETDLKVIAQLIGSASMWDESGFRCTLRDAIRTMDSKRAKYGDFVNAYARQLIKPTK